MSKQASSIFSSGSAVVDNGVGSIFRTYFRDRFSLDLRRILKFPQAAEVLPIAESMNSGRLRP